MGFRSIRLGLGLHLPKAKPLKHDVDYGTKLAESPDEFVRRFDDVRLEGLAAIEELHQFLAKNEELARELKWDTSAINYQIEAVIRKLRKI